jgi:DNA-binding XRE family transcriptional regulator
MIKQDKEFLKLVGALICLARINKGLLQEQVASMLGLSRPQMCNIEKGVCGTTPEIMFKMAAIFNCSIVDLFPTADQYKPKLKMPTARRTKPGRKLQGPRTMKPAYLVMKENEELKKQLEQYINQKEK